MGVDKTLGVPGAGQGVGRSKGGSGDVVSDGQKRKDGTAFFPGSAHNNPSPRDQVKVTGSKSTAPFPAERRA